MIPLSRDGFTESQIKAALHNAHRKIGFRFELLDKDENRKKDLSTIESASISFNALSTIKRTARFAMKEDNDIDYLNDKIKPYMRLYVPPVAQLPDYFLFYSQNQVAGFSQEREELKTGWVEFPLGIFLLSSPSRKEKNGKVFRDIDAYDGTVILKDDKFDNLYTIVEGTNYKVALTEILEGAGITKYTIEDTDKVLPISIQFDIGSEKISAVNELISQINFTPIRVDVNGYFVTRSYVSPSDRAIEYTYKTDQLSVIFNGSSEDLDLYNIPNKWVVVRTNAEQEPIKSVYENNNPESITSNVSRGRTIVDYREIENIADQAALDAYVSRLAFERSQIFGYFNFETSLMPFHDYADILQIEHNNLNVSGKYSETSWDMDLKVGGKMKHSVRRIITI